MQRLCCSAWPCLAILHSFLVAPTTGAATVGSFAAFTEHYGRVYGGGLTEYEARRNLFEERAAKVLKQNLQPHRRWTAAINAFSDRTANELTALRGWTRHGSPQEKSRHEHGAGAATRRHGSSAGEESLSLRQMGTSTSRSAPHKSVSWAFLNATKRHYDQGSCGSCWAIASAVLLEAHSEIHAAEGKGRTFSAQELVSCVPNPEHCGGTGGCEGATIELAMEWTMKHGLADDSKVPYKAMDGECRVTKQSEGSSLLQISDRGGIRSVAAAPHEESPESHSSASSSPAMQFGMIGWERLPENSYDAILHALQDGPIGISVAASDWFEYSYGVFDKCEKDAIIDHAVVMIGYGQEEGGGDGYWLLKNSWGPEWGEHGLMRLLRKTGEEDEGAWCGTDRQPELGSGCDGGPKEVTVCGTCGILYDTVVPHWKGSAEKAKERALSSEEY